MAFVFTPDEPIKYTEFDYEKFMGHILENSTLSSLSFSSDWKKFWVTKLQKEDENIKSYINHYSNTNPLLMRAKQFPEQFKERNEMFLFEYRSGHGENFSFHFDIERVNYFTSLQEPSKLTLKSSEFYIDPDTKYDNNNLQDHRLPYFTQMFTIDKPYIIIDGNKRVMARLEKGIKKFEGYEINPDIISQCFFTGLETWFYTLLYEIKLFTILIFEGKTDDEIKRNSNAFTNR